MAPPGMIDAGSDAGGVDAGPDGGGGPPHPESCVSRQALACDATAGKLVTDPRTGYDPELGGAFLDQARALGEKCWQEPIRYESFLAVLAGTGDLGADCTPDDTSLASLRTAELSCKHGAACHLGLRADGQPVGTCEKRTDSAWSHPLDCPGGQWCDLPSSWSPGVWGTCRPIRANGWGCAHDLECESYSCAFDGKCAAADDKSLCLTVFYASAVKADRPLGYWRLGEAAGVAVDASGNHHDATPAGAPASLSPGALAGDTDPAMSFNGTSDELSVMAGALDPKSGLSLECWVDPSATSMGLPVLAGSDATADGVVLEVGPAGDTLSVDLVDTSGQSHAMASAAASVTHDHWYHVVATYDGSHGALYLDGARVAEIAGVFTPRASGRFDIGAAPFGSKYFSGGIDEVAVYGAALTPYRVAEHHRIGKSGPNSVAWRFFRWFP